MESLKDRVKGVRFKDYNIKVFFGEDLSYKRQTWMNEHPNYVIINTHVLVVDGKIHQVIEYIEK